MFVYMPAAKKGKAHKFARPFHGPYRVLELTANDAKVVPVDKPRDTPILVALDRVRHCPDELPSDQFWPSQRRGRKTLAASVTEEDNPDNVEDQCVGDPGESSRPQIWKGRLRSRPCEDAQC